MSYVGKGNIQNLIQAPGDWGWQHGLQRVRGDDGIYRDEVVNVQLAHFCPKNRVCFQLVTRAAPHAGHWHWDGNEEHPTLSPSVNCNSHPSRCGTHFNFTAGVMVPAA